MKHITIDTGSTDSLGAFTLFEREDLRPGDTLRIVRRPSLRQEAWLAMVLIVMTLANAFLKGRFARTRPPDPDDLLRALAEDPNGIVDLRQELRTKHGVDVQFEPALDEDREFWNRLGLLGLSRAYGPNEPDISHITLLEPNPDYRPWKPGES